MTLARRDRADRIPWRAWRCAIGLAALLGCSALRPARGPASETACPNAGKRLGHRVCVHEVADARTWRSISFPAAAVDQERVTTYLVPAREGARVPIVFIDASAFATPQQSLHYKFLTESFAELASLAYDDYVESIVDPKRREWFAGSLTEFVVPGGSPVLGFTVSDRGTDPGSTITCEQFRRVHDTLRRRLGFGSVAVVPAHDLQRKVLGGCGLPIHDPSRTLEHEVYTTARGCGRLRRYTLAQLEAAEARAEIGWRDVVVTDQAPLDLQTVIAGILTGSRQGELSHLNVRSASRGTPNCYVKGAYERLAKREGDLVELECGPAGVTVAPITPAEARACQQRARPRPVQLVSADIAWTELVPLLALPTDTAADRRAAVGRFGAKGTNLAALYQRIDEALRLRGFLIPFHHYHAFVRATAGSIDLGSGPEASTFESAIERFLGDPTFLRDGRVRRKRLGALQAAMRRASCDARLLSAIARQVRASFGADDVMVRFRSSSNAEDALRFNGAGLYDSTSVCLADDTDTDTRGPSRCDPGEPGERGLCQGLTRVWASLWNVRAYEERAWYGIDHRQVAMGILVDERTRDERANIVAFTGNPVVRGDSRYLVNAQRGELDVVSPPPGIWPEKDLLTLRDGRVVKIERVRGASGLPQGTWVLDDASLVELGQALSKIADVFPVDDEVAPTANVLLDTEWKLRSDGRLKIKQVRPFVD